ncbi:response regulator receiver domain-containing protein [Christiangramia gaetbulicola]|uniref:Response regulator receiver domain-containing protein n=1 Tax=Christiangramia gaetbulicola TaxID=703340 RepID=A0A2T6AIC3_9FLAO|nr:response regulator [Christiangramia gaetbulicola]PTX43565.1 response regulator receiver domain-containing protein [Christiangramia gaetbulicola]
MEKFFLVDDEEIINAIQTRILKSEFPDSEILKFNTAKELLKILKEINYNPIIFLDLNMPEMDAISFLKQLEVENLEIKPTIFILTFSHNEKELKYVKNNRFVSEVISKPLSIEKLEKLKQKYILLG